MSFSEEKACTEKPEKKQTGHESKQVMITLAVLLGATIAVAALLEFLFKGVPLGFIIPVINVKATASTVLYYVVVIFASIYIGVIGIRDLVLEKRFSVEFLMSVAALGALYLHALFEAATVLFLYSIAEYFDGYIEDRARRTVEKLEIPA